MFASRHSQTCGTHDDAKGTRDQARGCACKPAYPREKPTYPQPLGGSSEASIYFDTPKRKLHKKGLLLRVRRIGGRYTQTIKASANSRLFERENARVETAMAAASRAFAHLADAKPFWR
jgi:hypothetical protein